MVLKSLPQGLQHSFGKTGKRMYYKRRTHIIWPVDEKPYDTLLPARAKPIALFIQRPSPAGSATYLPRTHK
jgi:hypothetical protein